VSFIQQPHGWWTTAVSLSDEAAARAIRQERDQRYGNIYRERATDERWVGDLGEIIFDRFLQFAGVQGFRWHKDEEVAGKPDFSFANGRTIGVKTVKRRVAPLPHYTAQVTARHRDEPVDQFFFLSYEMPLRILWLLGGIDRQAFLAQAKYHGPGDWVHPSYQVQPDHAIYNGPISLLAEPVAWARGLASAS
jgi:hypothetical protein